MMKIYGIFVMLICAACDQLSKLLIVNWFGFSFWDDRFLVNLSVFPSDKVADFLNLVLVGNQGVSFSLFSSPDELRRWIILGLTSLVILVLFIWFLRSKKATLIAGLSLVIGGAIGNIIDRVRLDAVIDFIDFHMMGWHWPAFNLADSFIFVGVIFLIWDSFSGSSANEAALPKGQKNA